MRSLALLGLALAMTTSIAPQENPVPAASRGRHSFNPPPLADDWVQWIAGEWEGRGSSPAGTGTGITRFEVALNGQFLFSHDETTAMAISHEGADYLKRQLHATDAEIERFRALPYRSLEIFSVDEATGDIVAYSFDSLRCIAVGRGRREGGREIIDWTWNNGQKSSRMTERIGPDRMLIVQRTPMPDGSVMEEKGESSRRPPVQPAPAATPAPAGPAIRAFIDAINRQDLAAMAALMTDDHLFIDSEGGRTAGRATLLAAWPKYFAMFPDYRIEAPEVLEQAGTAVALGSWSATYAGGRAPDARVGGPAAWKAVVVNGRIAVWQVYADHTRTHDVVREAQKK